MDIRWKLRSSVTLPHQKLLRSLRLDAEVRLSLYPCPLNVQVEQCIILRRRERSKGAAGTGVEMLNTLSNIKSERISHMYMYKRNAAYKADVQYLLLCQAVRQSLRGSLKGGKCQYKVLKRKVTDKDEEKYYICAQRHLESAHGSAPQVHSRTGGYEKTSLEFGRWKT